jgi:SAM-dependent methyltransferase
MTVDELLARHPGGMLKLNLGCGTKRVEGHVGVDLGPGADVTMDVAEFLDALPDGSVAAIYSRHFLEHVEPQAFVPLLRRMDRVLRPGGTLRFIVPHFSNPYFYSDPTHRQPFGLYTFSYLCETSCLRRHVPSYAMLRGWSLQRARPKFLPYRQPRVLGLRLPMPSDVLNLLVARWRFASEVFERYLCWLLPVYEVEFRIVKQPEAKEKP